MAPAIRMAPLTRFITRSRAALSQPRACPATRYDKLARNFLSAVALAAVLAFWI